MRNGFGWINFFGESWTFLAAFENFEREPDNDTERKKKCPTVPTLPYKFLQLPASKNRLVLNTSGRLRYALEYSIVECTFTFFGSFPGKHPMHVETWHASTSEFSNTRNL